MPTDASEIDSIEKRLNELRLKITEMGGQSDSEKAKTAAALGLGVFTLMLAAGAAYDLATGNASVQIALNVSRSVFIAVTIALGALSLALFALGLVNERRRNRLREAQLDEMEEEFAQLLERKQEISRRAE